MGKEHSWWVLEDTETGGFVGLGVMCYAGSLPIGEAVVFSTRKSARECGFKLNGDVVRKVRLDKEGYAVKVIPGR